MEEIKNAWFEGADYCRYMELSFSDCDMKQQPSIRTWLSWIAEIAGDDYTARGLSRNTLIEQHQVFLLSRARYVVEKFPNTYDKFIIRTRERGVDTIWFLRDFEVTFLDGTPCATASSIWLLCDPETHRILRPRVFNHPVGHSDKVLPCGTAEQLTPNEGDLLGIRKITYSDLDANGHLYSANYGHIFMDYLPDFLRLQPYRGFSINYVKEAKLDEELKLMGSQGDQTFQITAFHADGTPCFIAKMEF